MGIDLISLENIKGILKKLLKIINSLNLFLSLHYPYLWATDIVNCCLRIVVVYLIFITIIYSVPLHYEVFSFLIIIGYLSPLGIIIYLNDIFMKKKRTKFYFEINVLLFLF